MKTRTISFLFDCIIYTFKYTLIKTQQNLKHAYKRLIKLCDKNELKYEHIVLRIHNKYDNFNLIV